MGKPIEARVNPQIEIPQPTVQVIAETRKRKARPRFEEQDSPIEGVRYLVERGGQVVFNRRDTRKNQADTDRIARSKRHKETADAAKKRLVERKIEQPDFAGVISERGNYRSPLYSKEQKVTYDPTLLEDSVGPYHTELVREEGQLVLTFPAREGVDARAELSDFAQAVARVMIEKGRDPKEVEALITPTIIQRLDEERLLGLIAEHKVDLAPGTRKSTVVWEVPTDPLNPEIKPRKQKLSGKK